MVHDPTSRAAARNLLAESDVVPSEELTDTLAELRSIGQRPAPPISPALAEAMRQAASGAGQLSDGRQDSTGNVVPLRSRTVKRRGAAVSGVVVLAMAAGMGGVAAFGPGNAVGTAIESVIRWVAPVESAEPAPDEQPAPPQPESVPAPEVSQDAQQPAPASPENAAEPSVPGGEPSPQAPEPATSAEPENSAPATRKASPRNLGEVERGVVPPVELPELPVPLPDPVTTPRPALPVDPPGLTLPGGVPKPVPSADPSR